VHNIQIKEEGINMLIQTSRGSWGSLPFPRAPSVRGCGVVNHATHQLDALTNAAVEGSMTGGAGAAGRTCRNNTSRQRPDNSQSEQSGLWPHCCVTAEQIQAQWHHMVPMQCTTSLPNTPGSYLDPMSQAVGLISHKVQVVEARGCVESAGRGRDRQQQPPTSGVPVDEAEGKLLDALVDGLVVSHTATFRQHDSSDGRTAGGILHLRDRCMEKAGRGAVENSHRVCLSMLHTA